MTVVTPMPPQTATPTPSCAAARTGVLVGGLTALGVLWLLYVWVLRPRTRRGNRYLLVHRAHHTPQLDHQIKFW